MARRCELSQKSVLTGNNVSHAKNRTRRRFLPNLCNVSLRSEATGKTYGFRICARALRSVDHRGGLDLYLLKAKSKDLSHRARAVKAEIVAKLAGQQAETPAQNS